MEGTKFYSGFTVPPDSAWYSFYHMWAGWREEKQRREEKLANVDLCLQNHVGCQQELTFKLVPVSSLSSPPASSIPSCRL